MTKSTSVFFHFAFHPGRGDQVSARRIWKYANEHSREAKFSHELPCLYTMDSSAESALMWLIWKHLSGQTIHLQRALALPGSHRPPVSCHQNTEPSGPCQWPSKRECQLPGSLECPAIGGRTCTLCPGDHQTHLQVLDVTSDKSRFIEQTQQVFFFPSEMK